MAEPAARLWLNQARSDLDAARRLFDAEDDGMFCQTIAKHQQVVEKSVKAIAAAVRDAGIGAIPIGFTHDVERIVSGLIALRRHPETKNINNQIKALLHEGHRGEIKALCAFAPRKPGPGELARRNTEYPFQRSDGSWTAPHEAGSFNGSEVERFRSLASRILDGASRIIAALERLAKPSS